MDAAPLARIGSVLDLAATPALTVSMNEIRELHVARVGLIKDRTTCRNRIQAAHNKLVLTQLEAQQRQVNTQIARQSGKPAMVAITAVMSKRLTIATH